VLLICDAHDMNSGSRGQRRRWTWTYRVYAPKPQLQRRGVTFVGGWYSDDDRDPQKYICVSVTDDGRFCPLVPYWSGFPGPEFGHPSTFPIGATLMEAIAFCETYLAKKEVDW
jgi:hypothetical protein